MNTPKKIPCIDCLVFSMCKSRFDKINSSTGYGDYDNNTKALLELTCECPILKRYTTVDSSGYIFWNEEKRYDVYQFFYYFRKDK